MFKWIALALLVLPAFAHAGMEEGVAAYASGDYATAMKEFKELADKGDVPATYYVGFLYRQGYGVPIDQAEAAKWFLKAAAHAWNVPRRVASLPRVSSAQGESGTRAL